jgi:CRISPR system Cascade subunit CasC
MNKMSNYRYIDIHVLQTVPPSCVNRDDTGSPKTAIYGGVTRARVSSQAWKKAVRDKFRNGLLDASMIGKRTKYITNLVETQMETPDPEKAKKILVAAGLKEKSTEAGKDAPLFFMSPAQAKALAVLADNGKFDKKEAAVALTSKPAVDVALFGRMVADDANLNIDASCQVAHAISTHEVENEFDYFTAADDNPPEDKTDAGAGMIGTVEFNSSTLYRYATVAVHDLIEKLDGKEAAAEAVRAFTEAFVRSMPTGKINTFANHTPADYVMIALRNDTPVNFVGAFENPVKPAGGYVDESIRRLEKYEQEIYLNWYDKPEKSWVVGTNGNFNQILDEIYAEIV